MSIRTKTHLTPIEFLIQTQDDVEIRLRLGERCGWATVLALRESDRRDAGVMTSALRLQPYGGSWMRRWVANHVKREEQIADAAGVYLP